MKREIFIIVITIVCIWLSFFSDCFYGLLLYAFYQLVSPLALVPWSGLSGARIAFVVAFFVILSALKQRQKLIINNKVTIFCILFLLVCFISLAVRKDASPANWDKFWVLTKLIIMLFVASGLINDLKKLRMYFLAVAIFIGPLTAYYGFFGLMAGSWSIVGPGGGRFGDNNGYAVFLNMLLPFVYYAAANLKKRSWRFFGKIIFAGNIIAVMLTFSRGGFITLMAVLFLIVFNKKRKLIIFLLCFILIFCYVFVVQSDFMLEEPASEQSIEQSSQDFGAKSAALGVIERFKKRISTIKRYKEERAARSRFSTWKAAIKMANDYPVLGVGLYRFIDMYDRYDESYGLYGIRLVVHNNYLEILADTGYTGLFLFILILIGALSNITIFSKRIKKLKIPGRDEFLDYASALRISIIAFMVGSVTVNLFTLDAFWIDISISIAMYNIAKTILGKSVV